MRKNVLTRETSYKSSASSGRMARVLPGDQRGRRRNILDFARHHGGTVFHCARASPIQCMFKRFVATLA
jgi:hypothetical protein